jgi:hypothetical protein
MTNIWGQREYNRKIDAGNVPCYFDADLWKIFIKLSYFYRQICAKQVSKAML